MTDYPVTSFTTLGDMLVAGANKWPRHDALIFPDHRHTYQSLLDAAFNRAQSLHALGISPGDHVGILMANCPEYIECLMGAQLIGAMAVPINARYKPPELAYVVENADINVIVTHDRISEYANFAELLLDAFADGKPPELQHMVMFGEPADGFVTQAEFEAGAAGVTIDTIESFRQQVVLRAPAIMMYTSGTTAHPKGCPLNHEVLVRNGINMNRSRFFLDDSDRFWAPLPMFHMASILPLMCCLDAGAAMMSMLHVEAGLSLEMMETEGVTVAFPSFPTVTMELINHPSFPDRDLSKLRRINNVAPPDVLKQFQAAFPQAVQTGAYGLTEAGGVIAYNHPDESEAVRYRTCGKPMPGLSARIVDPETLEEVAAGQKGEILLKGYSVFDGYYKSPEKNAESFVDGWFRTGDLCVMDEDGYIEFHGRLKDMLKVGGENVAAIEIESLLATHPSIKMAQVIGVPDERLEEVACAYLETFEGANVSSEEVISFCTGKIASYKVPRHVRFVEEWPMSSTKIQKYVLRQWYDAEIA